MGARTPKMMLFVLLTILLWLWMTTGAAAYSMWTPVNQTKTPVLYFHSRPDITAPKLDIVVNDAAKLTPGYFFIAPWRRVESGPDPGAYIYDNNGELVWSASGRTGGVNAHYPHVCRYQNEDHICFFQGAQALGFAQGAGIIMDRHYNVVKTVRTTGAGTPSDMHEFRLTRDGQRALMTMYRIRAWDLSNYGIQDGLSWMLESVFQMIDLETGSRLFEWRSLDHELTSPKFGEVMPGASSVGGEGKAKQTPWDYFHINSVDQDEHGDFLISARHTSALYKISGRDGSIVWRLCGVRSDCDFKLDRDLHFSSQHDARWQGGNKTHTLISLFDNANNWVVETNPTSRGMLLALDRRAKSVSVVREFYPPEQLHPYSSASQGGMELLNNGHGIISWGENPAFSEHDENGEPIFFASLAESGARVFNYRASKAKWTAEPTDNPALWTYSRDKENTVVYVSWNGATEVALWNIYGAHHPQGPWEQVGSEKRSNFETKHKVDHYWQWVFAEAVDKHGRAIRRSEIAEAFVPSDTLRPVCEVDSCRFTKEISLAEIDMVVNTPIDLDPVYESGFEGVSHYPPAIGRIQPSEPWYQQIMMPTLIGLVLFAFLAVIFGIRYVVARQPRRSSYEKVNTKEEAEA